MCIGNIHTKLLNNKNDMLLCYRDKKHAENAVKLTVCKETNILLHETLKCYFCYISEA